MNSAKEERQEFPIFVGMNPLFSILFVFFPIICFGQCISGDCENGYGAFTYPSGDKYVGEWKEGKKHGQGTFSNPSGDKYVGEWKEGKKHGQGTFSNIDGSNYAGEWKDDTAHGQGTGTHFSPTGELYSKYAGEWKDNKFHGQGTYTEWDGTITEGEWKEGKKVSIVTHTSEEHYMSEGIRVRISEISLTISKVAVIGQESKLCDGSEDDGKDLAELVEGELLGFYGVVERRHLEEIINEQRLAMSGLLLDDSDFAQAGCLAGAQGTVLASYGCLQGQTKLQVKLVDCSTSDLYWSAIGLDVSAFDLMDALRIELGK